MQSGGMDSLTVNFSSTLAKPGFEGAILGIQRLSLLKSSPCSLILLQIKESYTAEDFGLVQDGLTSETEQQISLMTQAVIQGRN